MQQQPLWTKNFVLFIAANFFVSFNFYLLMTVMALYALQQFNASESMAGLASSIFIVGALVARVLAGSVVEKFGRKRLLYAGLILFLMASLMYFTVNSLTLLFIIRAVHGIAFGLANTAMNTTVMDSLPSSRRGEGTGYFSLSSTAAMAIGPFLGITIINSSDADMIFIVGSIIAFLGLVFCLFVKVKEADLTAEQRKNISFSLKPDRIIAFEIIPMALLTLLLGISYSSIMSFINIYAKEVNLLTGASYFFLIYACFLFMSRPVAGKLLDRKGDNIVIIPSIIFFAISLLLMSTAHSNWMLLAAGAFAALGFGTYMSSAQAIAAKIVPRNKIGLGISTFFIGLDAGIGLGPFLLGLIIPMTGYRNLYLYLSILVLTLTAVYYLIHGKKQLTK